MEEKPNYYANIPANVRYDSDLTANAKLLYGEITALCNDKGYCWATNEYFANLYRVSKTSISKWISSLIKKGYIFSETLYKEGTKEILNRYLSIVKYPIEEKLNTPIEEKLKENNTYINNTSINKKEIYKERFKKPTLEEVKEYCLERNNNIDAQYFIDYYTKIGWVYGKNRIPIKDWKACIRTWENNNKKTTLEKEKPVPDWFDKQLEVESDLSDEDRRFIEEVERCD